MNIKNIDVCACDCFFGDEKYSFVAHTDALVWRGYVYYTLIGGETHVRFGETCTDMHPNESAVFEWAEALKQAVLMAVWKYRENLVSVGEI